MATGTVALLLAALFLAACSSEQQPHATLKPTLEVRQVDGGLVAFQNGQPVPNFGVQPHPRLDLDGAWRFQAMQLNDGLSFNDRRQTLSRIKRQGIGSCAESWPGAKAYIARTQPFNFCDHAQMPAHPDRVAGAPDPGCGPLSHPLVRPFAGFGRRGQHTGLDIPALITLIAYVILYVVVAVLVGNLLVRVF